MKFRQNLKSKFIDHWRDRYLDYEVLKSLIENDYRNAPPSLNQSQIDLQSNFNNSLASSGNHILHHHTTHNTVINTELLKRLHQHRINEDVSSNMSGDDNDKTSQDAIEMHVLGNNGNNEESDISSPDEFGSSTRSPRTYMVDQADHDDDREGQELIVKSPLLGSPNLKKTQRNFNNLPPTQYEPEQSGHHHVPHLRDMHPLTLDQSSLPKEPTPPIESPRLYHHHLLQRNQSIVNSENQNANNNNGTSTPLRSSLSHRIVNHQQQQQGGGEEGASSPAISPSSTPHLHSTSILPIEDIIKSNDVQIETNFQQQFLLQVDKIDLFYSERFKKFKNKAIELCNMITFIKSNEQIRNQRNISHIKEGFQDCYRSLSMLESFREINTEGFEKLLTKYKKVNPIATNTCRTALTHKSFYSRDQIDKLISQVKHIYSRYFTGNDRRLAKTELRKPVPGDNRTLVFTVGLLIGACLIMGNIDLYTYVYYYPHDNPPLDSPLAWLLFRITLLPVLLGTLFSLQAFIYERTNINYVFIFQLKPEYSRSSLRYFKFGLIFILFYFICLYFYIDTASSLKPSTIPPIAFPILFICTSIAVVVVPFPVFASETRFWALKHLGRVMCAPFPRVLFADFFMSVMLLSLGDFFFNIQSMICIFNFNQLKADELAFCLSSGVWFFPIMNALPYYFRIMQCFRRYYDTGQFFPHITSAIRSIVSLVTITLAYLALLIKHDHRWNIIKTSWFIISLVGSFYKWYADMAVDWGFLLGFTTNKAWPLRERLVFSKRKYIYYIAMVSDLFLRYTWLFVFIIRNHTQHRLDNPAFLLFLSMGEVIWATQFIFFRVESEHCNTADKYSVYHDIPVPFSDEYNTYLESKKKNPIKQE